MGLAKVWVFAEAEGDKPATSTLELLTKAREIADTVEARLRRRRTPTRSRPRSVSTARRRSTRSTPATC